MNLSIGTLYSVKCKYNAPYKTKDNLVTYTGKVVPSAKYDPPSTFRLTTEIADFPFRVIDFKSVVSFNGDTFNYELPKEEVRTVLGSRGDVYTVDRKSTRLNSSHIQKSRMPSSA